MSARANAEVGKSMYIYTKTMGYTFAGAKTTSPG